MMPLYFKPHDNIKRSYSNIPQDGNDVAWVVISTSITGLERQSVGDSAIWLKFQSLTQCCLF